ncbi:preprotein translocase subunit SecE [Aestuariimicrobium sp. T2.26MG-19.2B]|uniref:preprotein translocase subunit SecE n=1 Tax=Aestuariimicrobium sp. T2.26MG-19.2B TaxID=3040679 RepID=UPI002477BC4C|nr:Protein translocase subunit SecE [Aestuariimicrobium sp. T2.26MG-19.2B]
MILLTSQHQAERHYRRNIVADDTPSSPDEREPVDTGAPEAAEQHGPDASHEAQELTGADDAEQLTPTPAAAARSSRPIRKQPESAVTRKKGTSTRRRDVATAEKSARTTPGVFVNQSVAELRKVLWPTGDQLRQYFAVVLVFVLIIIAYVGLLDFAFGWVVLKLFGAGKP